MQSLILASASPQRAKLLENAGIPFTVIVSSVDEDAHPEKDPVLRAQALAKAKAQDVASYQTDTWVLGCDTLVVSAEGELLEKPRDEKHAREMLGKQSGNISLVHSALCLLSPDQKSFAGISSSAVTFKTLSSKDIDWWIGTGLWKDRSGGFQIDGAGQFMIENLKGDWSSVVGLPMFLLGQLCEEAGISSIVQ